MAKHKVRISINGENFFWVIIENKKVVNRNATIEELDKITAKIRYYNKTNICPRCIEDDNVTDKSILYPGNACHEKDKNGKETDKWVCHRHEKISHRRYDPNSLFNIIKALSDRRTENQDPNSTNAKGDNSLELACELYGWVDLNKKNDNYNSLLDCYDPKTGLYHQAQGRYYNSERGRWQFTGLEDEWMKMFEDMVCFCISEDGKVVERIYIFPLKEIKRIRSISIYKCDSIGRLYKNGWYEQYRRTDKDELKKANEIWQDIVK